MGPEGPHPEIGPDPVHVEPQPNREAPHVPERQQNLWQRLFRIRAQGVPEADDIIEDMDETRLGEAAENYDNHRVERATTPEAMREINTPEEAVELMSNITAAQYRERKLQERYGPGIGGRWKAFMAGEFDFDVDQDGQIQKDNWNRMAEFGRRTLRTLGNKQTLASVGICVGISVLTGGMGLPAAAAIAGGITGRGLGEAWESFCGKRISVGGNQYSLREMVARRDFEEHFRLQEMAQSCQAMELTNQERNGRLKNLVNAFYDIDQETVSLRKQELEEDAKWNDRRDVMAKIGAAAGLGAGLYAGAAGLRDQIMTMDLDGNGVKHLVETSHDSWTFAYNNFQEALNAQNSGCQLLLNNGHLSNMLGEPTWKVVSGAVGNLLPHLFQVGAVAGGLFVGRLWEKHTEAEALTNFEADTVSSQHAADSRTAFVEEQIPGHEDTREPQTPLERWSEMFGAGREPRGNQIWIINHPGQEPVIYRVNTVDFGTGLVNATQLDQNMHPILDNNGENIVRYLQLDEMARFGRTNLEASGIWLNQFSNGGQIRLTEESPAVFDVNNRQVPVEQYNVFLVPNSGNVIFRRANHEDMVVPIFQLVFNGINRFTPEGQAELEHQEQPAAAPENAVANHVWIINDGATLPGRLAQYLTGTNFVINTVTPTNIEVFLYDTATRVVDRNIGINISRAQWNEMQADLEETPIVVQLQQAGGQQGGNRQGGNSPRGNNPATGGRIPGDAGDGAGG